MNLLSTGSAYHYEEKIGVNDLSKYFHNFGKKLMIYHHYTRVVNDASRVMKMLWHVSLMGAYLVF